jgi:hypothetical protein
MAARKRTRRAGDTGQFDGQADIWRGSYRLVERVAPSTWLVERLPDSAETQAAIEAAEGADALAWRQGGYGTTMRMRFVSAADYARHF